jgi:cytochrome c-type biogenesis protein CcmH
MRSVAALAVLATMLAAPAAVAACPLTSVADVEDEVMCPVCGTPLALATEAPQAQRERAFILSQVEDCRSKEEIKRALVAEFGPAVLALPPAEGFDLAAYIVPVVAVLLATAILIVLAVRWRRRRGDTVDDEPPPTAARDDAERLEAEEQASCEDEARLEADLRRYDL